jgi:hypothetical protein
VVGSGEHDDKVGGFIRGSSCLTSLRTCKQEEAVSLLESAVETVATVERGLAVLYVQ